MTKKEQREITAKEKEDVRRKLVVTAKKLAVVAKEKEGVRRRLVIVAEELRLKAMQLAITAKQLAMVAKEKEEVRCRLALVAEELRLKAKQLAITAKEKEIARRKLAVVAKELRHKAIQLATIAKQKEIVRRQLAVTAKQLAVTAKEREDVRKKLALVAEELRLKAEQQSKIQVKMEESEIRYRRLFETAHDGILILNSVTGQITDVNPFLEKLLGYSKSEFLDKKVWEVGAFKNINASINAFELLQKEGVLRYDDLPLETKDGRFVEVEFVSNSYMAGGTLVIQCNIRDITERKRMEQAKETKRLLDEEKAKVDSIADATHELRTPIAIIKGNVDLAMSHNGKNLKSPQAVLKAIDYEVRHLSSILSDLTMITSRGGELKNRIIFEKVNIKTLVAGVVDRSKTLAYNKNISITAGLIPEVIVWGDKVYLEKMLTNLVKNSIIYGNKNGHTKITAEESKGFIVLSVIDNGIGISKEDLPHVFERFYRADKAHSSDGNSIGLGLAIVKWVAEAHGGQVSVKNSKNKGSIFSVSLPIKENK